ncbi:hypothetical protein ABTZ59_34805 [Streptomyces sp. NPDC094034]
MVSDALERTGTDQPPLALRAGKGSGLEGPVWHIRDAETWEAVA